MRCLNLITHLTSGLYIGVYAGHGWYIATVEVGRWHRMENWVIDPRPARHLAQILTFSLLVAWSLDRQRHVASVYHLTLLQSASLRYWAYNKSTLLIVSSYFSFIFF